jgi:hypothetical protein
MGQNLSCSGRIALKFEACDQGSIHNGCWYLSFIPYNAFSTDVATMHAFCNSVLSRFRLVSIETSASELP